MNNPRLKALLPVLVILAALVLLALPAIARMIPGQTTSVASA